MNSPDSDRPQGARELSTTDFRQDETPCAAMDSMTGSIAARLDACPNCAINTEVPFGAYEPFGGGLVALYKCTDCGHRWHTSWNKEAAA